MRLNIQITEATTAEMSRTNPIAAAQPWGPEMLPPLVENPMPMAMAQIKKLNAARSFGMFSFMLPSFRLRCFVDPLGREKLPVSASTLRVWGVVVIVTDFSCLNTFVYLVMHFRILGFGAAWQAGRLC